MGRRSQRMERSRPPLINWAMRWAGCWGNTRATVWASSDRVARSEDAYPSWKRLEDARRCRKVQREVDGLVKLRPEIQRRRGEDIRGFLPCLGWVSRLLPQRRRAARRHSCGRVEWRSGAHRGP